MPARRVLAIAGYDSASRSMPHPQAELLWELRSRGIELCVFDGPGSFQGSALRARGVPVESLEIRSKADLRAIRRIRRKIREERIEILHLLHGRALHAGMLAAMGLNVKTILYRGAAGLRWHDPSIWPTYLNPRVDRIICNCAFMTNHVRQQALWNRNKVRTVYPGHDVAWYDRVRPIDRAELGLPEGGVLVGCVANFRPVKGLDRIFAAARLLRNERVMFLLVGRDVDNPEFRRWSAQLGCRMALVDFTPSPEHYVAACDIYVQPSRSEGLAKTLMEAMSMARPSIVDRVGGSHELIEDGRSGLVIDTGDPEQFAAALTALAEDPPRRIEMGNQARATVATRFTMEQAVKNQIAVYDGVDAFLKHAKLWELGRRRRQPLTPEQGVAPLARNKTR